MKCVCLQSIYPMTVTTGIYVENVMFWLLVKHTISKRKHNFYSCKVAHSRNNSPSLFQIVDSQYELISEIDTTLKLSNASFCLLSFKDTVVAIRKQLSILCVFVVSYDQEQSNLSASVSTLPWEADSKEQTTISIVCAIKCFRHMLNYSTEFCCYELSTNTEKVIPKTIYKYTFLLSQ